MRTRTLPAPAALGQWLVLAAFGTVLLLPQLLVQLAALPHFCLFERVTGVACPGCGVTGALLKLANGDPAGAWQSHPGALLLPFYLLSGVLLNHLKLTGRQRLAATGVLDYGFLVLLALPWTVSTLIPHFN